MATIAELLRSVAGTGEVVSLVYRAGSRPGRARDVVPIAIADDELVAVEVGTEIHKTYKLSRIASVELGNGLQASSDEVNLRLASGLSELPPFATLEEYVSHVRSELTAAGWHIHEEKDSFGVGTRFKNGKAKETPSVMIRYFDPTMELVVDLR